MACTRRGFAGHLAHPLSVAAALLLAASCAGLMPVPRRPPGFAAWHVQGPAQRAGCAEVEAWAPKSGRAGAGFSIELSTAEDVCEAILEAAVFRVGKREVRAAGLPAARKLGHATPALFYVPFEFDADAAFREGARTAELVLTIAAGKARSDVKLDVALAGIARKEGG